MIYFSLAKILHTMKGAVSPGMKQTQHGSVWYLFRSEWVGGGLEFQNPKPSRMFSNVGGCYRDSHCFGETQQPGFFMFFQGLLLTSYLGLVGVSLWGC